ncbi:unnamed protein product, partial [marine sediment metagenome]
DGRNDLLIAGLGGGYAEVHIKVPSPQCDGSRLLLYFDEMRTQIKELKRMRAADFASHSCYNSPKIKEMAVRWAEIRLAEEDVTCGTFKVWFYLLPGEEPADFQKKFMSALRNADPSQGEFQVSWMPRPLLPSEVDEAHPFVSVLKEAFQQATGRRPQVGGQVMSDLGFAAHYGDFPCVGFGATRWGADGMPHQPDEYVEVDTVMDCLKTITLAAMAWCGYETQDYRN